MTAAVVGGLIGLGLVLLVVPLMSLAGRARPLRRAARRLQLRSEQAERLQRKAEAVQQRALALQDGIAEATARAERLRERRRD